MSGFFTVDGLPLGPVGVGRTAPTGEDYVTIAGSTVKPQGEAAVPDAYCMTPGLAMVATRAGVEKYIRWAARTYRRPCIYWRSAPEVQRLSPEAPHYGGAYIAVARLAVGEADCHVSERFTSTTQVMIQERERGCVLTVEEVAEKLQVHAATVRGWLKRGILRGAKIGKRWYVTAETLEACLS